MQSPELNSGDPQNEIRAFLAGLKKAVTNYTAQFFLFLWLILGLVVISVIASLTGLSATHPAAIDPATGTNAVIVTINLFVTGNIARLWIDMPTTFTRFPPSWFMFWWFMLGAGVAERAGYFGTGMRAARVALRLLLAPLSFWLA